MLCSYLFYIIWCCFLTYTFQKASKHKKRVYWNTLFIIKWWPKPGSNWRHKDFQSFALPTELSGLGCGKRIWTYDLRVMSPTSYQTALSRDNNNPTKKIDGGETGIRTPARLSPTAGFQDQSLQPLGYFSIIIFKKLVDPVGLEPTTNRLWAGSSDHCAKGPNLTKMVAAKGLEPPTCRVWTGRSKPTELHRQN